MKNSNEKLDLIEEIENSDQFGENELRALHLLSQDKDEEVRVRAADTLAFFDSLEAEKILIDMLDDKSGIVRASACDSLCNSTSPEVLELLNKRLLYDKSSLVRGYSALSIVNIANNINYDKQKLSEFMEYILKKEKVTWVKINLYKILIMLGDKSYLKLLIDELNNRLYRNRYVAVKRLNELVTDENIDEIKSALIRRRKLEKSVAVRDLIDRTLNI
ncbi:HEAT repeat protein [Oxobacter pfennigii]|uniref:HEAT repeat protein n=1 Tax=Oxobacter pfennigii TaxID=36849 RepID=A0A0N8NTN6_9CLOT|nr:HEAT repeat domain-containing protein [Oxobacter pfennigii]KPU45336.1 HEAT repeat protein [Oxobacter pfennigii]